MDIELDISWKKLLQDEIGQSYFLSIIDLLNTERADGKIIFPQRELVFNAFNKTSFDNLRVVILGQDPYHNPGQAHGLSFSVPVGTKPPRSLINIFKEIQSDIGVEMPLEYGNLTHWAEQGVLLLNAFLTVRLNEPASHAKIGWMDFTDAVIKKISDNKKGIIFLLWGNFAQQKQALIDEDKHFLLMAAHPSPFSANRGFFGCKHFSKTNELLIQQGYSPIDWKLFTPTQQQIKFSNEG